jgi:AcrR family transcriptional regulator
VQSHLEGPTLGLRERKKARTRAAIQRHALRLFREQGYEATTISQIAEGVEISESTFFRYFPTKEAVVLWDEFDPFLEDALRSQSPDMNPIQALRAAFREVFTRIPQERQPEVAERMALVLSVPELRATMLNQFAGTIQQVAELVAERVGRSADDFAVRTLAGAVIGVCMAGLFTAAQEPDFDYIGRLDEAMALLEAGLPV